MWVLCLLLAAALIISEYKYFSEKRTTAAVKKYLEVNCNENAIKDKSPASILETVKAMTKKIENLSDDTYRTEKSIIYCGIMSVMSDDKLNSLFSEWINDLPTDKKEKDCSVVMFEKFDSREDESRDLTEVMGKILNRGNKRGEIFSIKDIYVCVIFFDESDTDKNTKDAFEFANHVNELCRRLYGYSLVASISPIKNDMGELAEAIGDAKRILNYHIVISSQQILDSDIIETYRENVKNGFYYPGRTDAAIANSVKSGDFSGALEKIDKIIERNFYSESIMPEDALLILQNILMCIDRVLRELNVHIIDYDKIKEIDKCRSPKQFICFLTSILQQAEVIINRDRQQAEELFHIKVENYVKDNFSDSTLNISSIAEHFKISSTHLSKIFKEQTGKRLFDYICECRIETAKKLLKKDKATVSKVMKQVGYYDTKTFTRSFKNIVGITPGKYKNFDDEKSSE